MQRGDWSGISRLGGVMGTGSFGGEHGRRGEGKGS